MIARLGVTTILGLLVSAVATAEIRIGVDWNGDGLIQTQPGTRIPVDAPTEAKPFVFWLNHDQDDLETGGETWPITRAGLLHRCERLHPGSGRFHPPQNRNRRSRFLSRRCAAGTLLG